jgi:hypothetical protein
VVGVEADGTWMCGADPQRCADEDPAVTSPAPVASLGASSEIHVKVNLGEPFGCVGLTGDQSERSLGYRDMESFHCHSVFGIHVTVEEFPLDRRNPRTLGADDDDQ